ncbi:uncharacterized protein ARMOST_20687 [Armillaria ostoyae]|uniref:F-box domain-containing protein n=1 Tax=Armillaria ostoyae TaxID=47428 RepID=A0A284S830_ARMOS|nr:uncharacterized protein ARMOST_20687 [Armillaria ostoyae]
MYPARFESTAKGVRSGPSPRAESWSHHMTLPVTLSGRNRQSNHNLNFERPFPTLLVSHSLRVSHQAPASDMVQPRATTILSIPTEILEIILLWEYPECDAHYVKKELLQLSTVCCGFREVLARHIYCQFPLNSIIRHPQPLIETFSFRGHLITALAIQFESINGLELAGPHFQEVLTLFRTSAKHLTRLRSLHLIILPECKAHEWYSISPISPSATRLSLAGLKELKSLFKHLPPQLEELVLAGFSLRDATRGLAKARLPNLRRICLQLNAASPPPLSTSNFLRGCPNVKELELPASWCPKAEWFRRAFDGRRFEHLRIGFTYNYDPETHSCTSKKCEWNESIIALFSNSSQSLKSVTIGTTSFPCALLKSAMPGVTSLCLSNIEFVDDGSILDGFLRPFLKSPLERLTLEDCEKTPENLTEYLDPSPNTAWQSQSGSDPYWPTLKYFEATLYTQPDRVDVPEWDEEWDELSEGDHWWSGDNRRKLEKDCNERGIEADILWEWFDGFG